MKKTTYILLLGVVGSFYACNFESFDERCAREAREHTERQCPRRMDPYTVMDSLTYDRQSHTLNYYYTLEGMLDNDTVMTPQIYDDLEKLLLRNVVQSVELKTYKEKGLNFAYRYYSKSTGKIRFQTLLTPEDYR